MLRRYVLVELTMTPEVVQPRKVIPITVHEGLVSPGINDTSRLLIPDPQHSAFLVFDHAVVIASLIAPTQQDTAEDQIFAESNNQPAADDDIPLCVEEDRTDSKCSESEVRESVLYDALFQSIALGYATIAIQLLDIGANPNQNAHGKRVGKVKGRLNRRDAFQSSPLHMACLKAQPKVVAKLIEKGQLSTFISSRMPSLA